MEWLRGDYFEMWCGTVAYVCSCALVEADVVKQATNKQAVMFVLGYRIRPRIWLCAETM
jgi:hypothetical protein